MIDFISKTEFPFISIEGDKTAAIQWSFISVGIWWALFSVPIMLFVEEKRESETKGIVDVVKEGIAQFKSTFNEIRHLKVVATFLLAYWLYIDGVDTTVRMAANFGINLGFGQTAIMGALVLVQFVAFFATLLYIKFSDKVGIKNGIYTAIFAYVVIVLGTFFVTKAWHFYILAVLIGCFQGGIQTLSRSLYSRIIPKNKSGEFFGFFNMLGKFAAVFGPLIMGSVTLILSNSMPVDFIQNTEFPFISIEKRSSIVSSYWFSIDYCTSLIGCLRIF